MIGMRDDNLESLLHRFFDVVAQTYILERSPECGEDVRRVCGEIRACAERLLRRVMNDNDPTR